jgi:hypothetical protein
MPAAADPCLPVVRLSDITYEDQTQRWLVDQLGGDSSVGVIGGAPKCAKTWLGLDLALSVATGTPCLGTFAVPRPGPVLVYLAEDALPIVRQRVAGMAQRGPHPRQTPQYARRQKPTSRCRTGGPRGRRPTPAHAQWLATPRLRTVPVPPLMGKRERND